MAWTKHEQELLDQNPEIALKIHRYRAEWRETIDANKERVAEALERMTVLRMSVIDDRVMAAATEEEKAFFANKLRTWDVEIVGRIRHFGNTGREISWRRAIDGAITVFDVLRIVVRRRLNALGREWGLQEEELKEMEAEGWSVVLRVSMGRLPLDAVDAFVIQYMERLSDP